MSLLLPLLLLPAVLLPLLLVLALLPPPDPVPPAAAAAAPPPDAPAYLATKASYNGSSSKPPLGTPTAPPTTPLPPPAPPPPLPLLLVAPAAAPTPPEAFFPAAPALGPCSSSPPASSQYCRAVSKYAADSCGVACSGSSRGGVTRRHSARPCTWRPAARSRQRQPPISARRAHSARARMAWAASAGEGAATWCCTHTACRMQPSSVKWGCGESVAAGNGTGTDDAGRRGCRAPCDKLPSLHPSSYRAPQPHARVHSPTGLPVFWSASL